MKIIQWIHLHLYKILWAIIIWIILLFLNYLISPDIDIGVQQAHAIAKRLLWTKYDIPALCKGGFERNIHPSWTRWENIVTHEIQYWKIQDSEWSYLFSSNNGTCTVYITVFSNGESESKIWENPIISREIEPIR